MIDLFGGEKFKPLVRFGKVIPGFYVAKDGSGIIGKKGKKLSIWKDGKGYPTTSVVIDSNFFDDYTYATKDKRNTISLKIPLHRAVMETWKPIDENPPDELADTWNQIITPDMVGQPRITPEWKKHVSDSLIVDHKDSDINNNNKDNLQWVIPKDNETNRKKQKFGL